MKRDKQATIEKQFLDPRSYVDKQGREVLKGEDWDARKRDLEIRSNRRCERYTILRRSHDAFCSGKAEEPHHIIPRSKGRDDRMTNLAGLSHACHKAEDPRQPRWSKKSAPAEPASPQPTEIRETIGAKA